MKSFENRVRLAAGCLACAALPAFAQVHATTDRLSDALAVVVPLGAAALAFYEHDTPGLKELGYSIALAQGTTEVFKHVVNSERPDGTGKGFPSGHTSLVFASSAYVHRRYGWEMAVPFYLLSTAVAYSRVHTNHHFSKDVVGGAAIGIGSGLLLTHPVGEHGTVALLPAHSGAELRYANAW
ncbi:MAG: Phosphoesterase, PA-phosphatase related protein [Ramlibacter sp.]|nr:Phosphoesterase, PA-phosphatase related protein [Ramlibacter sp.]